jgi:hypothetical protein
LNQDRPIRTLLRQSEQVKLYKEVNDLTKKTYYVIKVIARRQFRDGFTPVQSVIAYLREVGEIADPYGNRNKSSSGWMHGTWRYRSRKTAEEIYTMLVLKCG